MRHSILLKLVLPDVELWFLHSAAIRSCKGNYSTRVWVDTRQQVRLIRAILEALKGYSVSSNLEVDEEKTIDLKEVG